MSIRLETNARHRSDSDRGETGLPTSGEYDHFCCFKCE